jgi:flagellar motor protein MotB
MTSTVEGKIEIDILVIRVGDVLKMAVPSIIFRQDASDFGVQVVDGNGKVSKPGITEAQAKNNERILKRIAQILNKFKNYTVTVEGHANSVTGTEEEETTNKHGLALVPLSEDRAKFVVEKLKKYGVSGDRLSAVGRGGRQPVAARGDKDNAWKNRRVEFILKK